MIVQSLEPQPSKHENFRLYRRLFIPKSVGCYALATFDRIVLYVGRTNNLRRRFEDHLDDPNKTTQTKNGKAFFFYWLECKETEIAKIERTWLNESEIIDGELPLLNKIHPPT